MSLRNAATFRRTWPHGWWRNPENTYVNKASQRMAGCLAGREVEQMLELLVEVKSVGYD